MSTTTNKQALRKLAKVLSGKAWVAFTHKASKTFAVGTLGHKRGEDVVNWTGFDGQANAEAKAKFIAAANPATVMALLDELEAAERRNADLEELLEAEVRLWTQRYDCANSRREAAEKRYEDMLRQARSFREAHDSASEIIRKLERNKPVATLPTTKLWAGKIACYEAGEIIAMLAAAGISVKGE